MNVWLHTVIAIVSLYAAYYAGTNWGRKNQIGAIFTVLINSLESDGYIRMAFDADGDKEIIPISEIERIAVIEACNRKDSSS